jgi:N-acetylglucosaminyldiphosphoundecaprenol N-acetyl-beta-D-mannosaminyltransferase
VDALKDLGKRNLLGVLVDAVDYECAVEKIIAAALARQGFAVTALAVHGVMTGVQDPVHRYRLNDFDLVTPDGQPVRWGLNLVHGTRLEDRVYGPTLTLKICEAAAARGLPIYLYGSKLDVVERLVENLGKRFPGLVVAGAEPSKFRPVTPEEKQEICDRIRGSGAAITFVGLGCPRQEIFTYEYRDELSMPTVAVGAAFDYHAGLLREPPRFMQKAGLQWLFRLAQDPRRLWKRYVLTNSSYLAGLSLQVLRLRHPDVAGTEQPPHELMVA